ncbi:3034_t:CDS:2 [Entrophospora sp. SA101]|nr:3034_t:CDS:2 [Entrophospora sp. SA101]
MTDLPLDIFTFYQLRLFLIAISVHWIKTLLPVEIAELIFLLYDLTEELRLPKTQQSLPLLQKSLPIRPKTNAATGQHLPRNQKVFRHYNYQTQATTYFYRANEQLVGQVRKPFSDKKHFRLGTRSLNPLSLLNLATKHHKKEAYLFKKPKKPAVQSDFQEFLIIRLLLMCKSAEFTHIPLEQDQVPKETGQCAGTIYTHFTTKPVLRFTFQPEQATVVRSFIAKLDTYALEYDMTESKDFTAYPITHDHQHQTTQQLDGLCGCEIRARNQYLNN